ncbi:hypothetical protein OF829_15740 [Sphingomonas sp. LB-2]|uniref:hypothetical protein n=1 Tax=Sphingomonas caeni TaxID=2984949 RepID=UPI0022317CFC|nr:hypothetical protein [Sphingomonas caeni]MCW3848688.1 hypothetical protein [Sphingomonas caeni]
MAEPGSVMLEIERLLTQVVVVALTIGAASLTRRGIYGHHDGDAIVGGCALAVIWVLTILFARWRQGPGAWWLLISAPVVLAMPMTNLLVAITS